MDDSRTLEKPRVLVIDDEVLILDLLQEFLAAEGFFIARAESAEAALNLLSTEPFDLVLTDLKMAGQGGIDVLRRVAQDGSDTVTIVMTGFGTVETAIEAMKLGAFDYLLKPFKPDDVIRLVRKGLERQRLARENMVLRESLGFYELSEALSGAKPLGEQLQLIIDLVRDNFHADSVAILADDPKRPGVYTPCAAWGPHLYDVAAPHLIEMFKRGETINVHGDKVHDVVKDARRTDSVVYTAMAAPLKVRGIPFGMLTAMSTRPGHKFTEGQRKGLAVFGGRAANAIETARMHDAAKDTFTQTIEGFARALEAKDAYTHGHSDRVAMYARMIAEALGLPSVEVDRMQHGGLLHDIGKIGIRSHELNKPQRLTPAEYTMFKTHPVLGRRIIEPIAFLVHLVPCIYHHHESFDGKGYPEGLGGEDIPFEARILSVADAYDAMTSSRPYRKALPHSVALQELRRCAKKQFDGHVVEAFCQVIEDFRKKRSHLGLPVPA